ncbi:uncharacterized protein LOC108864614 [Galendromus occidentalis]|uniref:Uncharacterized protein LOC108864614 n=1 Tax=Galendromus occidentalis TaxID=34638 RepID=A0AAJ7L6P9_9ACAR|nr:uncharacterized protein LOC108864614 [Galendromus occidentalis]
MLHLRVSAVPFMFLVTLSEDGSLGGTFGGKFDAVCRMMNTTYKASLPSDHSWGSCNQTKCSGMFAAVLQNETEVALGPHSLLETYAQHFEPGSPLDFRAFNIITGMHTPYAVDSSAVLRLLDTGMYICLFVSPWMIAVSVVVTVWLQQRTTDESSHKPIPLDFGVLVISGYQTILSQSGQYHNRSATSRLIVIAFILVCLFVSILFSSFIKASMMNKPPTKRILHLRDLVKERDLRPIIVKNTYLTDLIELQAEVSSDYRALNRIFEEKGLLNRPSDMLSSESTGAVLNGSAFAFAPCEMFRFYYYRGWQALKEADRGYYHCSKDVVIAVHVTWYFSRVSVSNDFIKEFNRKSRWLVESPQKYVDEYRFPQIPIWYRVYETPLTEEKADPIALHDMLGSVLIYLSGLALACVSLLLELTGKQLEIALKIIHKGDDPLSRLRDSFRCGFLRTG